MSCGTPATDRGRHELRARVQALTPADQPRAVRPHGQVHSFGQLGDPRALTVAAVSVDRLHPRRLWEFEDRLADGVVELIADREADVRVAAVGGQEALEVIADSRRRFDE